MGALAMGAGTYEGLLSELPAGWPYPDRPTWVFSHRDLPVRDGADVRIAAAPVTEVHGEMLAAARERNLWMVGGGRLASQFAAAGLIDDLFLAVIPVVLGGGVPLFAGPVPGPLALTGTRTFDRGMVELRYELARPPRAPGASMRP